MIKLRLMPWARCLTLSRGGYCDYLITVFYYKEIILTQPKNRSIFVHTLMKLLHDKPRAFINSQKMASDFFAGSQPFRGRVYRGADQRQSTDGRPDGCR